MKQQLLEDISLINTSLNFPYVPRHHDNVNKAVHEIDNLFLLLSTIDKNKLTAENYTALSPIFGKNEFLYHSNRVDVFYLPVNSKHPVTASIS